jgi:hypothetical protein
MISMYSRQVMILPRKTKTYVTWSGPGPTSGPSGPVICTGFLPGSSALVTGVWYIYIVSRFYIPYCILVIYLYRVTVLYPLLFTCDISISCHGFISLIAYLWYIYIVSRFYIPYCILVISNNANTILNVWRAKGRGHSTWVVAHCDWERPVVLPYGDSCSCFVV